ncbi:hypothetical protein FRC12_020571 [Ceratobasidium sp. 428]|nr:hypothetical protein FRC12_020571 [Ceratobasidium sp. 428]
MWLVFEYYGRFPAAIHPKVRFLALTCFSYFGVISSGMLQLSVEKRLYAEMFADEEGVSLLARVLLLITDEGNELEVLDKQDDVAEVYEAMATVTDVLVPAAPGHFLESSADWAKVARHLTQSANLWLINNTKRKVLVDLAVRPWARFSRSLKQSHDSSGHNCAYPRCFQLATPESTSMVRHLCQQCKQAAYCDSRCQRA